ncbi:hypothetical protein L6R53_00170 [Myxococcota bacterium]|nr:hypothetical protein [Myxococcota bacterium]
MRLITSLALLASIALACGGDGDPSQDAAWQEPSTTTTAAVGSFPPTAAGVCEQWQACGCLSDPMDTCLSVMTGEGMNGAIHSCIVGQGCGSCADAVGHACIQDYYAAASAASRAAHETTMDIINNYPTGGACAGGQTAVYGADGSFLRCQ